MDKHGLIENFAPGLKSRYNLFMDVYAAERGQMVLEQIERRGVRDARLLEAMRSIPRHRFVPLKNRHMPTMMPPCQLASSRPFRSRISLR